MEKRKERRAFERIEFVGAQVLYTKESGFSIVNRLYGPLTVKDLNICGACLETDGQINPGDLLFMEIFLPSEEEIRVTGNVRWTKVRIKNEEYFSGVQFFQFGWGEHFDSILYLQRLQRLCENYNINKKFPYLDQSNPNDLNNSLLDS